MQLSIDTVQRGDMTHLSRTRLMELSDVLEGIEMLGRNELLAIAHELIDNDKETLDLVQLHKLAYWLQNNKPVQLYTVQSVFASYVMRALQGKPAEGGKRKSRRSRKTRIRKHKTKSRASRRRYRS